MTTWPLVALGDLCDRISVGHVGPMANEYVEDGVPFLRSQNIEPFRIATDNLKYVPQSFHEKLRKSALRPGDVAVVRTGYPGTAAVIPEWLIDANCADLVVISPGRDLDPYFLAAVFNSTWGIASVGGRLVGSAQQHFNVGAARRLELRVPPLPIQHKVAAVLSAYDDLIENDNRRIKLLEDLAQRIYREWFVEFRYPGHEGMAFARSDLGLIPDGWDVQPFASLGEYVNGYAFKPEDWGADGLPIVKIRELKNGVTDETPRYAGDLAEKYVVRDGDLLFSWSADLDAYVWTGGTAWLNQHLFRIDPVDGIPSAFLFHALRERMGEFRGMAQGTTMRHIKRAALTQVVTVVPPEALRSELVKLVEPIDALTLDLVRSVRNLRATRDVLLPRLISGEVDVTELDIVLPKVAA